MSLQRILEPEVMDSADEANEYDAIAHQEVNQKFVDDLLAAHQVQGDLLDLGTGTAQIPILLCNQASDCRVMAVDLATAMLDLARYNVETAGHIERINLAQVDAKQLEFEDGLFSGVISNSIIHHLPDPLVCLREADRVTRAGGFIFFRDLARPDNEDAVAALVQTNAGNQNAQQQKMLEDSLRAALTVDEMRQLVSQLGHDPNSVQMSSDRHWTWSVVKTGSSASTG